MASRPKQNKSADQNKGKERAKTDQTKKSESCPDVAIQSNKSTKDLAYNWTQDENDVKVTFVVGKKLTENDIDTDFKNEEASFKLTDGRSWKCRFHRPIIKEISRVKIYKNKLIIQVGKKNQGEYWNSLEYVKEEFIKKKVPLVDSVKPIRKEQSVEEVDVTIETETDEAQKDEPKKEEEKPMHELTMVKHDWYEKGSDLMVVHIYIKNIKKDELQVLFESQFISVVFKSTCPKFLQLHEGTDEDTRFRWDINLVEHIDVATCKYKLTPTCVDLTLKKTKPGRWGVLEKPQQKQETVPAPEKDKWVPATRTPVSDTTIPDKQSEPAKPDPKPEPSKVIFDEMETEKPTLTDLEDMPSTSRGIGVSRDRDYTIQKPTCMVSPLNKESEGVQVVPPGMTGLDNLGNTCFMNSVLQVLANTQELRDYFLERDFQKDINPDNPLSMGGRLAVSFAVLLRYLWSGKHRSCAPGKLKNLIAQKASQFTGFAQHDAQEFMAFLLDGLHEDVNRIKKKPYTKTVDSDGRPDEVVAAEAWDVHKKRNDSFIVELFQGQYKSKLVCPVCSKVSITFDPFMILPVPLPKKQRLMPVVFMSRDPTRKPVRYMLQLPKDAVVEQMKEGLSQLTNTATKNMRVFEVYKNRILKFFSKGETLASITATTDKIVICEVLSEELAGEPVLEIAVLQRTMMPHQIPTKCTFCRRECKPTEKLKRCTKCFRAAYCNHECQRNDWHQKHRTLCRLTPEPVGWPFILSIPESQATYSRLVRLVEAYARYSVDVFQPPVIQDPISSSPTATVSAPGGDEDSQFNLRRSSTASSTLTSSSSLVSEAPTESSCISSMSESEQSLFLKASSPDDISTSGSSSADSSTLKEVSSQEPSGDSESSLSPLGSPKHSMESLNMCDEQIDKVSLNTADDNKSLDSDDTTNGDSDPVVKSPPTRLVMSRPKDLGEGQSPNFLIRPCDKDGKNIVGGSGARLEDHGEEPLDLSACFYLAMDWKNNDKLKSYVLIQSRELECEDDSSMHTMNLAENNSFSLDQCLSLFTEPEILSPEHAWYCPQCKEHREATKQLSIWKLPHTLIIQLKRFSFRNLIWRDKIDKMVDFPVRGLDLSDFFVGSRPSSEPPPLYDLYGVVNHHGGLLGGHYTAYGRCANSDGKTDQVGWRLFDDSMVSYTSEKQVVTRSAYVLFYRRRNIPAPSPDSLPLLDAYVDQTNPFEKSRKQDSALCEKTQKQEVITTTSNASFKQDMTSSATVTLDQSENSLCDRTNVEVKNKGIFSISGTLFDED